MLRRIYFENGKKSTKKSKSWVEVEMDFVQIYDNFSQGAMRIRSISSHHLLFWLLLKEMVKGNVVYSNVVVYERFRKYLEENGCDVVSGRTFQNCFRELSELGILIRTSRGCYYLNPHLFWRAGKMSRNDFIEAETKEKRLAVNIVKEESVEKKDNHEFDEAFQLAQQNAKQSYPADEREPDPPEGSIAFRLKYDVE